MTPGLVAAYNALVAVDGPQYRMELGHRMDKQLLTPDDTAPLDPAAVPSRGLSKEQKRHIRRALGVQATSMVDDILHKATQSFVSQQAVAREVIELRGALDEAVRKLTTRADGLLAFCGENETKVVQGGGLATLEIAALKGRLDVAEQNDKLLRQQLDAFRFMTVGQRLAWALFGRVIIDRPEQMWARMKAERSK